MVYIVVEWLQDSKSSLFLTWKKIKLWQTWASFYALETYFESSFINLWQYRFHNHAVGYQGAPGNPREEWIGSILIFFPQNVFLLLFLIKKNDIDRIPRHIWPYLIIQLTEYCRKSNIRWNWKVSTQAKCTLFNVCY